MVLRLHAGTSAKQKGRIPAVVLGNAIPGEWTLQGLNLRPSVYETDALTN